MTQEIIEMAEKSGVAFSSDEYPEIWQTYMHVGKKELEAFAKLVAEAEKERIAKKIEQLPFGDTAQSFAIWVRNDT